MASSFFDSLLSWLRVRSATAGLEVSDEAVRMVYFDGAVWQMHAIRLAPGVMEQGVLKDRDTFVASLTELKKTSNITKGDLKKKVSVTVSLSSTIPYSKAFRLPDIQGQDLDKAIDLNVQIAFPGKPTDFYADWQIIDRDVNTHQFDVLSAFMGRAPIDATIDALFAAGFVAMAVESKALALTRVFAQKGSGVDIKKSYVLALVDGSGLEFLIIKNGSLYFEYAHRWADIANTKGEISFPAFQDELVTSMRRVLNFYGEQWSEPVNAIVLATVAFNEEIEKAIAQNIALPAVRLTLVLGQPISSEWLVALGCSLRNGAQGSMTTKEINFLGEDLQDRFHEEETTRFLGFWQIIVPVALVALVIGLGVTDVFLGHAETEIRLSSGYALLPTESQAVENLTASSTVFNNEVAMIKNIESTTDSGPAIIGDIEALASAQNVAISRLTYYSAGTPINLSATAPAESNISAFKEAMQAEPQFNNISLPLSGIQPAGEGYSFSMTFYYQVPETTP